MATKPVQDGYHTINALLTCADAAGAIAFYTRAFGAQELLRIPTPDGRILHAALRIGDSTLMLNDEMPGMGGFGPLALKGTPVTIHLATPDVDAMFSRAVEAGATPVMPVADMFWGDRYGMLVDPFGHRWSIATHLRDMSPQELAEAAAAAMAQAGPCPQA